MRPVANAPTLEQALLTEAPASLDTWLDATPDRAERERQITDLGSDGIRRLAAVITPEIAERFLAVVEPSTAARLVAKMTQPQVFEVANVLDTDIAADTLRELAQAERDAVIAGMSSARARLVRDLLQWPKDSAASQMIPEPLVVSRDHTAAQAMDYLRQQDSTSAADSLASTYVYVIGDNGHLDGVTTFRDLVLASPTTPVLQMSETELITVGPLVDVEIAARRLSDNRLVALPVVTDDGRLLGIITADRAADIAENEATEDAERQGGAEPLDVPYLEASPVRLWRKRVIWLLVLFVAEAYTGTVLRHFEDELEAVVSLAFFIPLLIGTGGNTGTQITTTIVRAAATGNVRLRDLPKVLAKELSAAGLISLTMAAAGMIRAFTLGVGVPVMTTVAVSLAAIVLWSAFVASVLPLILTKTRVDPAVVSAPMIATVVDGTGLVIYFMIARALLPELG